ncbi:MAG TPA: thioesterase family protein [Acidimicrobiales bacterium]|nr:thioesterase family protein [Acidimicrobiales bacterium]
MDAAAFLGLEPTPDPTRWRLPVTPGICTGFNFLFGGAGLAAAVVALEQATGRPLVWATAQYLSFVRPPSVMDIEVTPLVPGNQVTQARAVARADGHDIITVTAALGSRDVEVTGTWMTPPVVPPPDECPTRVNFRGVPTGIGARLDSRLAEGRMPSDLDGTPGTGRTRLWVRVPEGLDMSAATVAVLGDHVPFGINQSLGLPAGGNSLDNTVRIVNIVPTDWVLLDVQIHAVANGFAHGHLDLWSEEGTLLATASQSAMVRFWKD